MNQNGIKMEWEAIIITDLNLPEKPAIPPERNSSDLSVIRSTCVATDPAYSSMIGQSWLV